MCTELLNVIMCLTIVFHVALRSVVVLDEFFTCRYIIIVSQPFN